MLIIDVFISTKCFFSFKNKFAKSKMIKSSRRSKHVKNEKMFTKKKGSWWETFRSMLEPGVRYLPHPGPAALNLDAAVDLSKKSSVG